MPESPSDKLTEDSHSDGSGEAPQRQSVCESASVPESLAGKRFDYIAAQLFPEFSRGRLQQWISAGKLTVDGQSAKNRQKLQAGSLLSIDAEFEVQTAWRAEPMPLDIVFEDEQLLVVNKPRGCVVHPAPGLSGGTLANAVLAHCPGNAELPRCGIIHRLDKDTTGLLVVAKSLQAHASLVAQLQRREVKRVYRALACGQMIAGGTVDQPIGRHPTQRTKMAVLKSQRLVDGEPVSSSAKPSVTHYRVARRFADFTELRVELETGRTHQIRVHMAFIKHPLHGDATYNPRYRRPAGISEELDQVLRQFNRQALHATELSFNHPTSGESCAFTAEPPEDYRNLLETLAATAIE